MSSNEMLLIICLASFGDTCLSTVFSIKEEKEEKNEGQIIRILFNVLQVKKTQFKVIILDALQLKVLQEPYLDSFALNRL